MDVVMKAETFPSMKSSHKWSQEAHLRCVVIPVVNSNLSCLTTCQTIVRETGSKVSKKEKQCSLVVKWCIGNLKLCHMFSNSWFAGLITIFVCIFSYEPEIHPAASYRIKNLRSTVQVFSTGSITVTGKITTTHSLSIIFSTIIRV